MCVCRSNKLLHSARELGGIVLGHEGTGPDCKVPGSSQVSGCAPGWQPGPLRKRLLHRHGVSTGIKVNCTSGEVSCRSEALLSDHARYCCHSARVASWGWTPRLLCYARRPSLVAQRRSTVLIYNCMHAYAWGSGAEDAKNCGYRGTQASRRVKQSGDECRAEKRATEGGAATLQTERGHFHNGRFGFETAPLRHRGRRR